MQRLGFECGRYLAEVAERNTAIWVFDGDLADSDGAEIFCHKHPTRFIQSGIAEQCMVTAAAGMAACDARPWVFSFAAFLCYRAYDQIRVGLSQTKLPVTLVGSHSGGCGGKNGKTHLALNDIAILSTLPNIEIWSPADQRDVQFAVDSIIAAERPSYLRLPRAAMPSLSRKPETYRWIGAPTQAALVTHGLATHWALDAQQMLAQKGLSVGVLQVLKLWPLDHLLESGVLDQIEYAVVLEDHNVLGGLGTLLRHLDFRGRTKQLGWPITWTGQSGEDSELRRLCGLSLADIVNEFNFLESDHV